MNKTNAIIGIVIGGLMLWIGANATEIDTAIGTTAVSSVYLIVMSIIYMPKKGK